jgi:outer membrane protein, heavy metal efflux system
VRSFMLIVACFIPIIAARGQSISQPRLEALPPTTEIALTQPPSIENIPLGEPAERPAAEMELADLEALALANNPALAVYAARVDAIRGDMIQAGIAPNPVAGYASSEIGEEGTAGQQGGFVGQEFITAGKLRLSRSVAGADVRVTQEQYQAQRLRVLNDVRLAFVDALISQRRVEISERLLVISQRAVEIADLSAKSEEATRADFLQARVEAGSARILLNNSRNELVASWRVLGAVAGVSELPPTKLKGELTSESNLISFDEAAGQLRSQSPEAAAARGRVVRERLALQRAIAQRIPNVEVQATLQHDNASHDDIVGIQAGLPIPFWNRNQGGIVRAEADLVAAQNDVRRVQLDLERRLAITFQYYENARQQVATYEETILPDANSSLDLVTRGYQAGEFGYLMLLTSQRTYFQTNLSYLESLRELCRQRTLIEGLLLVDSLASRQ